LAWLLACVVYLVTQGILNGLFASTIGAGEPVCRLQPWHLLAAFVVTLAAAAVAAAVGGRRIAELEPSLGLRD
jgi:putative ABC transport system permease protein